MWLNLLVVVATSLTASPAEGTVEGTVIAKPARFLADTVVYLQGPPARAKAMTAAMDQRGMQFLPHVLPIQTGDSVRFDNHDNVSHNVKSPDHGGFDLGTFTQGHAVTHPFVQPGSYAILCAVHPEMLAYVFAAPNPHAVAVDAQGRFKLEHVPVGAWTLAVWNPHLKAAARPVAITAGVTAQVEVNLAR
jgi:plastocyanin